MSDAMDRTKPETNRTEGRDRVMPLALRIALASCASSLYFWVWLAAVSIFVPWFGAELGAESALVPACFGTTGAGLLVGYLAADHLASYRARVVPGYREMHLSAMGLTGTALLWYLMTLLALSSPIALHSIVGWTALAFAAGCIAAGPSTILGWGISLFLAGALLVGQMVRQDSDWLAEAFGYAQAGWVNLLLLLGSAGIVAQFGVRLWRLDEDSPAFGALRRSALAQRMRYTRGGWPTELDFTCERSQRGLSQSAPLVVRINEWRLERALRRGPNMLAWQARRWDFGRLDTPLAWEMPPAVLLATLGIWLLASGRLQPFVPRDVIVTANRLMELITPFAVIGTVIAFQESVFGGSSRGPLLAFESLRPAARVSMLRQRGIALLCRLAGWSAIFAMLWGLHCAVSSFRHPGYRISLGAAWGAVEIASLIAFSGLIAWLQTLGLNIRDPIVSLLVLGTILIDALVVGGVVSTAGQPGVLYAVAAAMLLVGALLFRSAYCWWLVMDLE
jgi:hypothetical protein